MSQNRTTTIWNRNFILFTSGMELSVIAQGLLHFALPLYILRLTGDPAMLGAVLSIKDKLQKGLKDEGFTFQALSCSESSLLPCRAVLRPARTGAYFPSKACRMIATVSSGVSQPIISFLNSSSFRSITIASSLRLRSKNTLSPSAFQKPPSLNVPP